ncbi:P-type ATPase, partial [Aphelenchoides avenae]
DVKNLWVAIIIIVMIIVMCAVSWWQEREARRIIRGFENLLPENAVVIRDGTELTIPATKIVVGDIIRIRSGARVSADARMLWVSQLKLETSSITGESEPIEYQAEAVEPSVNIFDSKNVAFNGSLCVDGEGVGVVIRTGQQTVIGQIAGLTTEQKENPSRLRKQTDNFVKFLVLVAPLVGLIMFIVGGFTHQWKHVLLLISSSFLVCAVALIPEGMPATVTTIMTVVARRLAKKSVYVKRLEIIEALGSCNIIASDKTGTLTKNMMTVTDLWYMDEFISGWPNRNTITQTKSLRGFNHPLTEMLSVMAVCNSSEFVDANVTSSVTMTMSRRATITQRLRNMDVNKVARGTPSEIAMIKYADELVEVMDLRKKYDMVFEIPFNSKRKYHLMIARLKDDNNGEATYKLLIKGASDILVKMCSTIMTTNGNEEFTGANKERFEAAYNKFGEEGRRVIGFAEKTFKAPVNEKFSEESLELDGLVFCGICAIMDPPRDETADSIKTCKEAGIKVFMITGDHPSTAKAIASQIGLIDTTPGNEGKWEVLHGEAISKLTSEEWDKVLQKEGLVFARTTPEQKLLIVEECQKRKHVIAMTGDGVNDSPALKRADIGVAMGSGSEVAKQAADIVLMDDNFTSIVRGIYEGRRIYDNIKKLLGYVMLHSVPEVFGTFINFCFGMPVGLTTIQVMCIDLGTELPPGIAYAWEPGEGDIMKVPPRNKNSKLISFSLLSYAYGYAQLFETAAGFLAYCSVFWWRGISVSDLWMTSMNSWSPRGDNFTSNGVVYDPEQQVSINMEASAAWMVGIVVCQSIFSHGLFVNMHMNLSLVFALFMCLVFVYVPGLNTFLFCAPVPLVAWGVAVACGVALVAFNE